MIVANWTRFVCLSILFFLQIVLQRLVFREITMLDVPFNNRKLILDLQMGLKIEEGTPLNDDLLLHVSDSLDLFAAQFIKDTVRRNVS